MFKKIIITSGPTLEPIDPIRFLSNRSSGKTGYHLAMEATGRQIGPVVFITGPTFFLPPGVELVQVETSQEMRQAVWDHFDQAAVVIMAAAVSDYRSRKYYPDKMKKSGERIILELVKTPDILFELGQRKRQDQFLVGFAAETEDIFANAQKKLSAKNLDLLVLNEISPSNPAFGCEENQVYLLAANAIKKLERMSKAQVAVRIWDEIMERMQARASQSFEP